MNANLVCWHCGNSKAVEVDGPPQFAFQLAGWANDVGMLGVLDNFNGRALVFCDQDCLKAETTKRGTIRLRARGPAKAELARAKGYAA